MVWFGCIVQQSAPFFCSFNYIINGTKTHIQPLRAHTLIRVQQLCNNMNKKALKIAREKTSPFNYCVKMSKLKIRKRSVETASGKLTLNKGNSALDEKRCKWSYTLSIQWKETRANNAIFDGARNMSHDKHTNLRETSILDWPQKWTGQFLYLTELSRECLLIFDRPNQRIHHIVVSHQSFNSHSIAIDIFPIMK